MTASSRFFAALEAKLLPSPPPAARAPAHRPDTLRCTVADPTGTPLNIRDKPNGAIIGSLPNGFRIEVARSAVQPGTDWVEIASTGAGQRTGWVYRPYIECSTN